jgi:hypothetical protein
MNNPACEDQKNTGPLPEGQYEFNTSSLQTNDFFTALARLAVGLGDWGSFRVPLTPYPGVADGRGGFYLHGGSFLGSAGCIDVGGGIFGDDATTWLLGTINSDPDGIVGVQVLSN